LMSCIFRILKYDFLRVPPTSHTNFDNAIDAQFGSLAMHLMKNKKDKKSVSFK
jgi:hypothetical protein